MGNKKGKSIREIYWGINWGIDREINREINREIYREINKEMNREINTEINRKINREINKGGSAPLPPTPLKLSLRKISNMARIRNNQPLSAWYSDKTQDASWQDMSPRKMASLASPEIAFGLRWVLHAF